jgi:hypothetical protein
MLAISAAAQASVFVASLSGAEEVPANGSSGTGLVFLFVDDTTRSFHLTGGFGGLSASVTSAHIHGPADPGVNAAVMVPLTPTGGTLGTLSANGVFTLEQFEFLQSGLAYVNVHTSSFPGGEIRGQLAIPEPGTYALIAGLGLCAFASYRRFGCG